MIAMVLRLLMLLALAGLAAAGAASVLSTLDTHRAESDGTLLSGGDAVSAPVAPAGQLAVPPLSTYRATIERPAFFEGRRVPQATPPAPSATAEPLPPAAAPVTPGTGPVTAPATDSMKLLGIMVQGGSGRALIEVDGQAAQWLGVGSKVRDWSIDRIESERVVLRTGRRTTSIELYAPMTSPPGTSTR